MLTCSPEVRLLRNLTKGQGGNKAPSSRARWPVRPSATESVGKLQRKAFSAVVTRAQSKRTGTSGPDIKAEIKADGVNKPTSPDVPGATSAADKQKKPWAIGLVRLVEPQRFSSLSKLCGSKAWTRRAAETWLRLLKVGGRPLYSVYQGERASTA